MVPTFSQKETMMTLVGQLERSDFHDSDLGQCLLDGDVLYLQFRNISLEIWKEEYYTASVILRGVQAIRHFDEKISKFNLEGESSNVLQFNRGEGRAVLLVEWVSYKPQSRVFAQYEFDYDSFELTGDKQDGLII